MAVNLEKSASQSFSLTHETFRPELQYQNTSNADTDRFTYLGVTFDNKLSWRLHVERLSERVTNRLSILKLLAGCKWECARSTINTTFNTFTLPLMTYCCEAIITAPQLVISKLEVLQNQALRLNTGAVKSTSIDAMLLLTGNKPFQDIMKEKALKVLDIRKDLTTPGDIQALLKPRNPLEVIKVDVKLDLVETIHKKRDVAPSILRSLALETIPARYPATDWLHIFTDGSQFDCLFNAGAGVYSNLFSFYAPAGFIGIAFDGEVVAMRIALKQLLAIHHKFDNAVLLSDSQAAIKSISLFEPPLTPEISDCQELLRTLTLKGKRIVLQWVPALWSLG
ncbi:hypothetical protein AVEN_264147-1 [Araneus ventricosus]|uniref:RNase H type-1 domain-containing protein n=1 Tax=Araneus ventricosus TaxID=182803 RepID=A0A4Y2KK41_ARAVE